MPHFFVNASLVLIGILGLFVISLMLFSYRSNIFVNIYLVIAFILCSIRNIFIGLSEITDIDTIFTSKHITPIYLFVVPALYIYFKSLVKDLKYIHKKVLIHFIYPFLNLVLNLAQEYFPILNNQIIENIRFASLVVFVLFYLALSFKTLYNGLWKQGVSNPIEKQHFYLIKNWTLFLFIISALLYVRILYAISLEKISEELYQGKRHSFFVIIPWLLIYGKILINPEILYGYPKLKKRLANIQNQVKFNNHIWVFDSVDISNLQDMKLKSTIEERVLPYISDIENHTNTERPFRNSNLTFSAFAKTINIPASHLNYIFKYHAVVTFVEYRNFCRIKDALELIDSGALNNLTLEGLAGKVGFSSYNSFFTAFKKQTNSSPKDYLSQHNK